jgi:NAD-dependent deacetylase
MSTSIDHLIEQAIAYLKQSHYAVALTGAGISTPSGIPDFRSPASGLWDNVDPMAVASIYGFKQNPDAFYEWIYPLAQLIERAVPNPAHQALADLEQHGPLRALITQNIDLLHSQAGSQSVYEVHGHLREATCQECQHKLPTADIFPQFLATKKMPGCPLCRGVLKPDVVLFGEMLPMRVMQAAQRETKRCDLMLVAGSSLAVAPAGDLPLQAKMNGARLIIVNYDETHVDFMADVIIRADVADILPRLAAPFSNGRSRKP